MEARDPNQDAGTGRMKSAIRAAAKLLAIYVAMYLAVGAIAYGVRSLEVFAAVAPDSSMAVSAISVASLSQARKFESLARGSSGK